MFISPAESPQSWQYNFGTRTCLTKEGVTIGEQYPQGNYDVFKYHEVSGTLKFGMTSPWYEYHDLYAEANATAIIPHEKIVNAILGTHHG